MKSKYNLLFKTGDSEIRALERSNFTKENIFPIIELTRGRKSKKDQIGLISKRIDKLSKIFSDQAVCLDLTTNPSLTNAQIEELYIPSKGYSNWVEYIKDLSDTGRFDEIVPTILVDVDDDDFETNLHKQVKGLSSCCKKIAYRNNIADDGYYDDIELVAEQINNCRTDFIFILDCEYVPSGATHNTIAIVNARIAKIKKLVPHTEFIVVSTSFPRYVSDIGNDINDVFPLNELTVFEGVQEVHNEAKYGDYASINPIRNDEVVMARGWIPRIDVPTLRGIFYHRERNKLKDYAATYSIVARKVYADSMFPLGMNKNWGIEQIVSCKDGSAPGSAPSYWISVRMSIYIEMQLKRLGHI